MQALSGDVAKLETQLKTVVEEKDVLGREKDVLGREKDVLGREQDGLVREKDGLVREKDGLIVEMARVSKECKDLGVKAAELRKILVKCRNTIEGWWVIVLL